MLVKDEYFFMSELTNKSCINTYIRTVICTNTCTSKAPFQQPKKAPVNKNLTTI